MMAASQSVLVMGAGELGMAILEALARHPSRSEHSITVLLRQETIAAVDPAKVQKISHLRSLGVGFLDGDLSTLSVEDLALKFSGYHTIIGCSGMAGGALQLKLACAVLATQPSVTRYIPWQFGIDYDIIGKGDSIPQQFFRNQIEVRDMLRGQDKVQWVIISTGVFMSFLFEATFGIVDCDQRVVRAFGSWDNELTSTTAQDIGRVTAEVVWSATGAENEVIYTAGETLTYARLAEVVEKALGNSVRRELWTLDSLEAEHARDPTNGIIKYRATWAEGKAVAWDKSKTFNARNGIRTTTIEDWAMMNLSSQ